MSADMTCRLSKSMLCLTGLWVVDMCVVSGSLGLSTRIMRVVDWKGSLVGLVGVGVVEFGFNYGKIF